MALHNPGFESDPARPAREGSGHLAEALDLHADPIFEIDLRWRISYANVAATRIMPPASGAPEGNLWHAFLRFYDPEAGWWEYFRVSMEDRIAMEFESFLAGRINAWMRVNVRPSSGGVMAFFHDINLERNAIGALEHSERLISLGRLATSIAHEIHNPLESVTNLLYLARLNLANPDQDGLLSLAEEELKRAAVIVSQVLHFARHRTTLSLVSCDALLRDIVSLQRLQIMRAKLKVDVNALAASKVLCNEGEIRQVLNNLITNAIEAMTADGGRLILRTQESTRKVGRGILVTVADTGTGMSGQTLARSFEPFFTTKGANGNGLGLWISREIAIRHGGTLKAKSSQQRGKSGSVFQLFLPLIAHGTDENASLPSVEA